MNSFAAAHWRSKVRIHRRDYNKLLKDIDKVRADLAKLLNRKMQHAEEKVRYIERNDLKAANAFVTFESRESFLRVTKVRPLFQRGSNAFVF